MKKIYLFILAAVALCGCQAEKSSSSAAQTAETVLESEEKNVDAEVMQLTLGEAQAMFPYVVKGTYTSVDYQGYSEIGSFQIEETYQGDLTGEIKTKRTATEGCEEGDRYILFLEKWDDVYADDVYYIPGIRVFQNEEDSSLVYEGMNDCSYTTEEELISAILSEAKSQSSTAKVSDEEETDYIHSDDLAVVAEQSPYVADVVVLERTDENEDRCSYRCQVKKAWKGELDEEIEVVLPGTDDLTGREYTLLLGTVEENSNFYVITSKSSVTEYGSDDAAQVHDSCK